MKNCWVLPRNVSQTLFPSSHYNLNWKQANTAFSRQEADSWSAAKIIEKSCPSGAFQYGDLDLM